MGLDSEQIKFLERFILRRKITLPDLAGGSASDSAPDSAPDSVPDSVPDVAEQSRQRKAQVTQIAQSIRAELASVDLAALGARGGEITAMAKQLAAGLAGSPDDNALAAARNGLQKLKQAIEHTREGGNLAAEQAELERALAEVPMLAEGLEAEQLTRQELAGSVRAHLGDTPPDRGALDAAISALARLTHHVDEVLKDIKDVRKPRLDKARAEQADLMLISLALPENCPEDPKRKLLGEHAALAAMLAPKLDWANITTWDAEDLIDIAERRRRLDRLIGDLRRDVEQASAALAEASAAATKAINPPEGRNFSPAQSAQMAEMFDAATQQGNQDLLAADGAITALKKLTRHALATARIRDSVRQRVDDLPGAPPAGASPAQQAQWHRLRDDALSAADEVL